MMQKRKKRPLTWRHSRSTVIATQWAQGVSPVPIALVDQT
jgi:hypothetical protein